MWYKLERGRLIAFFQRLGVDEMNCKMLVLDEVVHTCSHLVPILNGRV